MTEHDRDGVSRRQFIRTGTVAAAALAAGSCVAPERAGETRVRGACMHDCPDTCAWIVRTEQGRAVGLEGDPDHPYTRGTLCEKMDGFLTDVVYNPDRLLHPLKRSGPKGSGRFERVGWDEALEEVAARLGAIVDEHGGEAVLPYSFAGTMGLVQGWSLDQRLLDRLGASRLERKICGSTAATGLSVTLGTDTGILQEDLPHSRLIVMWGGNPVVTNPHGWPFVERAREAGARLVVIDPGDAAARGIADGDPVRVFNDRGSVTLRAQVTDDAQRDTVLMLHGWWASRIGGSSANALTHDGLADLGGGSAMHDTWVQVERAV